LHNFAFCISNFELLLGLAVLFRDRHDAGRKLAAALRQYAGRGDVLVLALPRGGVPVAFEVAQALAAPLDILIVRKLGVPFQPELAMGAVASGGIRVLNDEVVRQFDLRPEIIERVAEEELREVARRDAAYRHGRPAPNAAGKVAILIDDGLATGSTMRAAARAVRQQRPARLIVAVPVAAAGTCRDLRAEADEVVCLSTPEGFFAVGQWYEDFEQTSDDEVRSLLEKSIQN
jgi:putative phosphoribosyl transferase